MKTKKINLLLAFCLASLVCACSILKKTPEQVRACTQSCEAKFDKSLSGCNKFVKHEAVELARSKLLQACLVRDGWFDGQQNCRAQCSR